MWVPNNIEKYIAKYKHWFNFVREPMPLDKLREEVGHLCNMEICKLTDEDETFCMVFI